MDDSKWKLFRMHSLQKDKYHSFGSPLDGFRKLASPNTFKIAFIPDRTIYYIW